ncbi:hypothetical protein B0H34DRAFT_654876 [Crassisporium funariophilum]|nr:hypothetical protein B0H34DRAFT_654876 [Crassisporium funariophilum]
MPHYAPQDDLYASDSHFLSASTSASRKSPSRQSISTRRSSASLRPSSLAHAMDDEAANGRHHSLAHELAVALMPEPSAGSKLLSEEFGIEYDEGAEGIDESHNHNYHDQQNGVTIVVRDADTMSFADELGASASDASFRDIPSEPEDSMQDYDPVFHSPTKSRKKAPKKEPEQDAMEVLAQDVASTDKFLNHLRTLDVDSGSSATQQPTLEKLASDVIRRMNETVRDRESQVRELLECEREFRRIAGEVGGSDVLGQLDELTHIGDLSEVPPTVQPARNEHRHLHLDAHEEEPRSPAPHHQSFASDWELDPDRHRLGDDDDISEPATSPIKDSFPPPPSMVGPPTPASTIIQLAHLRSFTASLVSSLSTISEQAQVNGAATTEAGRKIRALKNKLGGWRTDWDSAERSRVRIERWEAGIADNEVLETSLSPVSPPRSTTKRLDGRRMVEEHLHAFELALQDASLKTQAIMAR